MSSSPRQAATFTIGIADMNRTLSRLQRENPQAVGRAMRAGITAATMDIEATVKNYLDGPVLNRRTGRLYRSINSRVFNRLGRVVGIVGTNVKYAAIHEFGGIIRPKKAGGRLMFRIGGRFVSTTSVKMPARPYMSKAFEARSKTANKLIQRELQKAISGINTATTIAAASSRKGVGFNAD